MNSDELLNLIGYLVGIYFLIFPSIKDDLENFNYRGNPNQYLDTGEMYSGRKVVYHPSRVPGSHFIPSLFKNPVSPLHKPMTYLYISGRTTARVQGLPVNL